MRMNPKPDKFDLRIRMVQQGRSSWAVLDRIELGMDSRRRWRHWTVGIARSHLVNGDLENFEGLKDFHSPVASYQAYYNPV